MTARTPLIEATELAALLDHAGPHADLRVVDCRFDLGDTQWGQRGFDEGHVPGAVYAHLDRDLSGPITPASGRHPLPGPGEFAATLGRWGVTPDTHVVAYDQGFGAMAARLWWLLRATGHARVQVLDGGFAAWQAAGLPVSRLAPPTIAPTAVAPRPFTGWLTTDAVRRELADGTLLLVDARPADRFAGSNETIDPVAGHVPGAVNMPFAGNLAAGRFLSAAALAERWRTTLAARDPARIAMMCGSGVTACHNILALEQAGVTGARLYAGSWSEWIRDAARPVAT